MSFRDSCIEELVPSLKPYGDFKRNGLEGALGSFEAPFTGCGILISYPLYSAPLPRGEQFAILCLQNVMWNAHPRSRNSRSAQ